MSASVRVKFDKTEINWPEVTTWSLALMLVIGLLLMGLSGCCTGHIAVTAIKDPIRKVTSRHDGYVMQDVRLEESERDTYLLTSELLNRLVEEAEKGE